MGTEIRVPVLPESVSEATIATWHKKIGEPVKRDEHILDVETDKIVLEVTAPDDGVIQSITKKEGDTVASQEVVGIFEAGAASSAEQPAKVIAQSSMPAVSSPPAATAPSSPSVRRLASENDVDLSSVSGSGKGGRITREDVAGKKNNVTELPSARLETVQSVPTGEGRVEKRVPMSRLRARIAERLIQAQQNAAILTTFNEINMQPVMDLRAKYKDKFEKEYGVRLGFMSFFVVAAVEALKKFPIINASVDGSDIIYHGYTDISIAVSSPRGLVVPVLRNVENMNMAEIEKQIAQYAEKAKNGKLSIEEMSGGTFTISNGGVFGSLMSTPILNPPQSAILGMHKIEKRVVAEGDTVVVKPMMYVALSYDHRIIDGSESVKFLVAIKELLEDPARFLLDL